MEQTIKIISGEYWYGLAVDKGTNMPLGETSVFSWHPTEKATTNQESPLLLSNKGRFLWSEKPYDVDIAEGEIRVTNVAADFALYEGFTDLKGAFLAAAKRFFPANSQIPPEDFFIKPQYNTWTELIYDQTQERILGYAHGIVDNGLPAGIMMIDDGWMRFYGSREFNIDTIPDAKAMVKELHDMGFSVMLWICPFISPDSTVFRALDAKDYLVRNADGSPAIREWWNGYSAVMDMSNPDANAWFCDFLNYFMEEYDVDGFKFDAGDVTFYRDDDITYGKVTAHEQCELWAKLGLKYKMNEYRACYKCGGLPLVQRLCDKSHVWKALPKVVADILAQGLLGFPYGCPDMIGGGSFADFLPGAPSLKQDLFVRYAQCAALMPMMQYSAAPWRVLSPENAALCVEAGKIHIKYADTIIALARHAAETNEPILRYMEYEFPGQGFATVTDQFMVGECLLVAPVIAENALTRDVKLPAGQWRFIDGTVYEGSQTITVDAPLNVLPYFEKI